MVNVQIRIDQRRVWLSASRRSQLAADINQAAGDRASADLDKLAGWNPRRVSVCAWSGTAGRRSWSGHQWPDPA